MSDHAIVSKHLVLAAIVASLAAAETATQSGISASSQPIRSTLASEFEVGLKASFREAPVETAAKIVASIPVSELFSGVNPDFLPEGYLDAVGKNLALIPQVMAAEQKYQYERAKQLLPGMGIKPEAIDLVQDKLKGMFQGAFDEASRPDAILRAFDVFRDGKFVPTASSTQSQFGR